MANNRRFPVHELHKFTQAVFTATGIDNKSAADATEVLLYANRRGVDTHGVRNLKTHYCDALHEGKINNKPIFNIEYETPTSARVNGDNGLGLAAACWGMRLAIQKAESTGMAMVSMQNSHHYGAAGYYPWMALQHDMIGISMTARFSPDGTGVVVTPTFAGIPMFSTNPIAIGFPTSHEPAYIFDMATSTVPFNRITMMAAAGESVPLGWGMDAEGNSTTDPSQIRQLHPLGGTREMSSHKGYGLAMMVSVLCATLSGGWQDAFAGEDGAFNGYKQRGDCHFFGAIRVDAFRPVSDFKAGMDAMIRAIHAAPTAPNHDRVYVAGELEHETEQNRLDEGIPLPDSVISDLEALSERYEVAMPCA